MRSRICNRLLTAQTRSAGRDFIVAEENVNALKIFLLFFQWELSTRHTPAGFNLTVPAHLINLSNEGAFQDFRPERKFEKDWTNSPSIFPTPEIQPRP